MVTKKETKILLAINILLFIMALFMTNYNVNQYIDSNNLKRAINDIHDFINYECQQIQMANYHVENNTIYLDNLEGDIKNFYNKYCYLTYN